MIDAQITLSPSGLTVQSEEDTCHFLPCIGNVGNKYNCYSHEGRRYRIILQTSSIVKLFYWNGNGYTKIYGYMDIDIVHALYYLDLYLSVCLFVNVTVSLDMFFTSLKNISSTWSFVQLWRTNDSIIISQNFSMILARIITTLKDRIYTHKKILDQFETYTAIGSLTIQYFQKFLLWSLLGLSGHRSAGLSLT